VIFFDALRVKIRDDGVACEERLGG